MSMDVAFPAKCLGFLIFYCPPSPPFCGRLLRFPSYRLLRFPLYRLLLASVFLHFVFCERYPKPPRCSSLLRRIHPFSGGRLPLPPIGSIAPPSLPLLDFFSHKDFNSLQVVPPHIFH
ncbi:unnamed protein product [Lactuca virosa]|uniref:Uncharacterized protein n=1 Tax=Lactuca virosa TaxID=75947 RepID=A0AAU9NEP9_9ASTR|nr:unnamed protein product [Lactuca virosa]